MSVGSVWIPDLVKTLDRHAETRLDLPIYCLELINIVCGDGDANRLNVRCGSKFVQKGQCAPPVYNRRVERTTGGHMRGLSLGFSLLVMDSDQIIFYAHSGGGNVDGDGGTPFKLLDRDTISSLLVSFVR